MQANVRALAANDIETTVSYYSNEAGQAVATDFVDELESAINHLCRHPETGSLRFAYDLEIPSLRSWPIRRFPYLLFYVPDDEQIDIWRVLHARRDIPAYLASDPSA